MSGPGNLDQLNSVCERLVLLTQKRNIDEVFLRQQLEQIAPRTLPGTEQIVLYKDQKAVEIAALLKKHHGNRQQVAAELGVSKTTLWRYLKKYGIDRIITAERHSRSPGDRKPTGPGFSVDETIKFGKKA